MQPHAVSKNIQLWSKPNLDLNLSRSNLKSSLIPPNPSLNLNFSCSHSLRMWTWVITLEEISRQLLLILTTFSFLGQSTRYSRYTSFLGTSHAIVFHISFSLSLNSTMYMHHFLLYLLSSSKKLLVGWLLVLDASTWNIWPLSSLILSLYKDCSVLEKKATNIP